MSLSTDNTIAKKRKHGIEHDVEHGVEHTMSNEENASTITFAIEEANFEFLPDLVELPVLSLSTDITDKQKQNLHHSTVS